VLIVYDMVCMIFLVFFGFRFLIVASELYILNHQKFHV